VASSAAASNTAQTKSQGKTAAPATSGTKIATPKMEESLVQLIDDLYKWAESSENGVVLGWFEQAVSWPDFMSTAYVTQSDFYRS
jgi:hypothetical protein